MRQSLFLFPALVCTGIAQNVVTVYIPNLQSFFDITNPSNDTFPPIATIKNVNPSTTEMYIGCPTTVPETSCGLGSGLDYTIISDNTIEGAQTMTQPSYSMGFNCEHNTQASEYTCGVTVEAGQGIQIFNGVYRSPSTDMVTATIVSGAEKLRAASVTAVPTNSQTSESASASATGPISPASTGAAPVLQLHGVALVIIAGVSCAVLW